MGNLEESIEYRILGPKVLGEELTAFTNIINSEWGDFFNADENILFDRLGKGGVFIGAYYNGRPAGILETVGLELEYPEHETEMTSLEISRFLCPQIMNYWVLTNGGHWTPHPKNANTLVLVDITKDPSVNNTSLAPGIVDYSKALLRKKSEKRPESLKGIKSCLTFTPDIKPVKKWHLKQGAFDTEFVLRDARTGYKTPDVNFMCYLAPGYIPKMGQRKVHLN